MTWVIVDLPQKETIMVQGNYFQLIVIQYFYWKNSDFAINTEVYVERERQNNCNKLPESMVLFENCTVLMCENCSAIYRELLHKRGGNNVLTISNMLLQKKTLTDMDCQEHFWNNCICQCSRNKDENT